MRIDRVTVHILRLPLREPFRTDSAAFTTKDTLIAQVAAGGLMGLGESSCNPPLHYSPEVVERAAKDLKEYVLPKLVGKTFESAEDITALSASIGEYNMAGAGVVLALWDLLGKKQGVPLRTLLGGKDARIATGAAIGKQESTSDLLRAVESCVARGYQRVKIDIRPGQDRELLKAVRTRFSDLALMADGGGSYSREHFSLLGELDEYELMMIEEPLGRGEFEAHAELQRSIATSICLGESINSAEDAGKAIQAESCRAINIRLARVGGYGEAKRIHDVCEENDVPVWCGSVMGTGVGSAHSLALASMPNFLIPGDISPSDRYFELDIVDPMIRMMSDGTIELPPGPGVGIRLDLGRMRHYALGGIEEVFRK